MNKISFLAFWTILLAQVVFSASSPDFIIAVYDNSPSTDVILGIDVVSHLKSQGYTLKDRGISRLFSMVDATKLDGQVTLAIYNGEARLIAAPVENKDFTSSIVSFLKKKGVAIEEISSSDIISSDLAVLFVDSVKQESDEEILKCSDSDGGLEYYSAGSAKYGNASLSDECVGTQLFEVYCTDSGFETEKFNCVAGCSSGACLEVFASDKASEKLESDDAKKMTGEQDTVQEKSPGFFSKLFAWIAGIFS